MSIFQHRPNYDDFEYLIINLDDHRTHIVAIITIISDIHINKRVNNSARIIEYKFCRFFDTRRRQICT